MHGGWAGSAYIDLRCSTRHHNWALELHWSVLLMPLIVNAVLRPQGVCSHLAALPARRAHGGRVLHFSLALPAKRELQQGHQPTFGPAATEKATARMSLPGLSVAAASRCANARMLQCSLGRLAARHPLAPLRARALIQLCRASEGAASMSKAKKGNKEQRQEEKGGIQHYMSYLQVGWGAGPEPSHMPAMHEPCCTCVCSRPL